ncbi:hypothetical protein EGW08_007061 [Elysia chlorotica]|uniref:Uncharacterized protein n=1 Tax=Elysia chlorotica TaxID=188477 RepID=A0A3S1BJI5_ELYCH|nr:hypothetical protein EGW08_007061 [Elysia chlorotica]
MSFELTKSTDELSVQFSNNIAYWIVWSSSVCPVVALTLRMMAEKESVLSAMDKSDTPTHSVDYYYLEAMRYLKCESSPPGEDSEEEEEEEEEEDCHDCTCSKCRMPGGEAALHDGPGGHHDSGGRERSWSHSMAKDRESETISELPIIDGKLVGSRLKNRRFSDGMLLKKNMKVSDGHVHWADECKKELTRCRPRKQYTRRPSISQTPIKSILKNGSEESLVLPQDAHNSSYSSSDD